MTPRNVTTSAENGFQPCDDGQPRRRRAGLVSSATTSRRGESRAPLAGERGVLLAEGGAAHAERRMLTCGAAAVPADRIVR